MSIILVLILFLLPIFFTIYIQYLVATQKAITLYVVTTIGACMRQNLPLPMALESAAGENTDKKARVLREISKWLIQGYSLSEAIKRGHPKCSYDILAMITASEKINQLPQTLQSIQADLIENAEKNQKIKETDFIYPVTVALIAFIIMTGLAIFIIPMFAEVLIDMSEGTRSLPWATQKIMDFSGWLISRDYLYLFLIALVVTILIFSKIFLNSRPRQPEKPRLDSRIKDFFKWHLSFMHWFEYNYSLLKVISLLRITLKTGGTINEAIRNAITLDINFCFKKRLAKWLYLVEMGQNISLSAKQCGIGNSLAWAFNEEVNRGNTPQILEMLEEFYRSNYSYKTNLVKLVMEPVTILFLGSMVGFVIYAMFIPMIEMISYLASDSFMP